MSADSWIWIGSVVFVLLIASIRVVQQFEKGVIFRLGRVAGEKSPGLRFLIPIIDRMSKVTLQIVTMTIQSQKIITKDNVSIDVAAVAYYHVVDATKSLVAIQNVYSAVNQIAQTTVRNIVGQFMLDEVLSDTKKINEKIKIIIDTHTKAWGILVTTVEIKDIQLPETMHPIALQLRNLQVLSEIAVEKNSTIVFPNQFLSTIEDVKKFMSSERM